MLPDSTLLVSRNAQVIRTIQKAHDNCDLLRLEICGRLDKAPSRLRAESVVLVIVHLSAECPSHQLRPFLRDASTCHRATTVLICNDEASAIQGRSLLQEGAADLLCLPEDSAKLVPLISEAKRRGSATGAPPPEKVPTTCGLVEAGYLAQIRRVAQKDTTILLTGETGTGKTMLARNIHDSSPRQSAPFTVVDCGAVAATLIESEMFGHVRGAFTGADKERVGKFAAAGDGTLVLDEINSLPLVLQAKLLRAVEERVFEPLGSNQIQPLRARIIAISNVPLETEVAQLRFRADLFYRLNVVGFRLPPLRGRVDEILELARRFLRDNPQAQSQGILGITPDALDVMAEYAWPGNVRELRNVIERAVALCAGQTVTVHDLPEAMVGGPPAPIVPQPRVLDRDLSNQASTGPGDEVWRICEALRKHRNNRVRAASELGISRVSLYKKLHKYGLFEKSAVID